MPKFVITERIPTYMNWTFEVEADNESDALEMVLAGHVVATEQSTEQPDYTMAEYEIEDENGEIYEVERGEEEEDDDDTQEDND